MFIGCVYFKDVQGDFRYKNDYSLDNVFSLKSDSNMAADTSHQLHLQSQIH